MKKLKLNLENVAEILTREQLKQVMGGEGSARVCYCGGGTDPWSCPVIVNPENPKNCTEICAETDC